jgi:hypothetical protein
MSGAIPTYILSICLQSVVWDNFTFPFFFILSVNCVSGTPNLFICCMHMWIQLFAFSDSLCIKSVTAPAVM